MLNAVRLITIPKLKKKDEQTNFFVAIFVRGDGPFIIGIIKIMYYIYVQFEMRRFGGIMGFLYRL